MFLTQARTARTPRTIRSHGSRLASVVFVDVDLPQARHRRCRTRQRRHLRPRCSRLCRQLRCRRRPSAHAHAHARTRVQRSLELELDSFELELEAHLADEAEIRMELD